MRTVLVLVLLSISFTSFGQAYDLGLNPPSIRWYQINTNKVRVVYPQGMEQGAQRVTNLVHAMYDSNYYSLGEKRGKVDMVLQNQSMQSNGFVTVGPFRSELITTPPQLNYTGSDDWLDLLTIHEYRHVEQYVNSEQGITKLGSLLSGQFTWGSMRGLAIPAWFSEGDAVFMETMLTNSGRGRFPDFNKDYRSLLLSDVSYSYEKAWAGSFKDFVPSYYNLGYYMTTYLRRSEGMDIWTTVSDDAVRYRGLFFPFSRSLKKHTGGNVKEVYQQTMSTLKNEWEEERKKLKETDESLHITQTNSRVFTSYRNPVFIDDSTLVVTKSSFNEIDTYVQLDLAGNEKRVITPGFSFDYNATLSQFNGQLIWSELRTDERWGNQDFHVIMKYDPKQHKNIQLTKQSKLLAPSISPDGRLIAAVNNNSDYTFNLRILDSQDGRTLVDLANPENYHYAFPTWKSST